ncbi:MAG: branched-chain amino acid ABC transporter permease [Ruminococcaceae bacterium]|nr:branched-chain amino acid ABC transporter permease [Oscillospiraceae bacterium]
MLGVLLPNITVNALVLASMYILASLGFAFIFNMLGSVNLAHGAFYMAAAYITYYLCAKAGLSNWVAMLVSTMILAGVGIVMERFVFRPFMTEFNRVVMVSVAIMTMFQQIAVFISGSQTIAIPPYGSGNLDLGFVTITNEKIVTFAVGIILLIIVLIIVYRTKLGMQMEAISQDRLGAALQGIPVNRVSMLICALGFALAAVAGSMMGAYQQVSSGMGDNINVRILMLVMLAGAGSMNGILITGVLMAILDSVCPIIWDSYTASSIACSAVVILLLFKPKGFFGHDA